MTGIATRLPHVVTPPAGYARGARRRIYLLEARSELLKLLRIPAFLVPTLGFPMMFYGLFGILLPSKPGTIDVSKYLLATYGAFGVIGIALFSLGVGVAVERGQGWLAVKRASPMPISAYFVGKYAMTVVFSSVLVLLLCAMALIWGGVSMEPFRWVLLLGTLVFGAIPFCAAGIAIAYLVGPNSAPAVVNAIYLPMAFLSGLFIPTEILPKFLQGLAEFLPPYHLARIALTAVGIEPLANLWIHLAALTGFAVVFTSVAVAGYRRDDGRTYG